MMILRKKKKSRCLTGEAIVFDHTGLNSGKGNLIVSTIELSSQRVNLTEKKISPKMKISSFQRLLRAGKELDWHHENVYDIADYILVQNMIAK